MAESLLECVPFRRQDDAGLLRLVETLRSALDPDALELEYLFLPRRQWYRRRFQRNRVLAARGVSAARRRPTEPFSLRVPFHAVDLVTGTLSLVRVARRPWTGAEVRRFELLQPFISQLLEAAARCEAHGRARWCLSVAATRADAPTLLLDGCGEIVWTNEAAEALLSGKDRDEVRVVSEDGHEVPMLTHIARLARSEPKPSRSRLALTTGRSLEACVSLGRNADGDGEDLTVVSLRPLASVTIEDVRPRLLLRGVTDREAEVVRAVLEGKRNAEIAAELCITEWTVKDHLKHIFLKLGVCSRAGLLGALYADPRSASPGPTPPGSPSC